MPAVNSPRKSVYAWPSTSHSRAPSPRAKVERERVVVQHRARVAAGHGAGAPLVVGEAGRVAGGVFPLGFVERRVERGVARRCSGALPCLPHRSAATGAASTARVQIGRGGARLRRRQRQGGTRRMSGTGKDRAGDRRRQRRRAGGGAGAAGRGLVGGAGRAAARCAGGDGRRWPATQAAADPRGADRRDRPGLGGRAVRGDRSRNSGGSTCCSTTPAATRRAPISAT